MHIDLKEAVFPLFFQASTFPPLFLLFNQSFPFTNLGALTKLAKPIISSALNTSMKALLTTILIFIGTYGLSAQELYAQAYGNPEDQALVFLHGGPGYNSVNFERSTAQALADQGFYLIVYDRRGEGRSKDNNAKFTFQQTNDDLLGLYKKYKLKKAVLLGHSFGGIVASKFAEKHPNKVESIILVGAPVSLQETFKTIITSTKSIYEAKADSVNLNYINMLEQMDHSSLQYSSYCFMHAMQNDFYTPKDLSEEALAIYNKLKTDSVMLKYAAQMTYEAPQGFWKNENYTTIDLKSNLQAFIRDGMKVYGIYGKEDGLYSEAQVAELKEMIGADKLKYLENCSHNVFIDQQTQFIEALSNWVE